MTIRTNKGLTTAILPLGGCDWRSQGGESGLPSVWAAHSSAPAPYISWRGRSTRLSLSVPRKGNYRVSLVCPRCGQPAHRPLPPVWQSATVRQWVLYIEPPHGGRRRADGGPQVRTFAAFGLAILQLEGCDWRSQG